MHVAYHHYNYRHHHRVNLHSFLTASASLHPLLHPLSAWYGRGTSCIGVYLLRFFFPFFSSFLLLRFFFLFFSSYAECNRKYTGPPIRKKKWTAQHTIVCVGVEERGEGV